MFLAEKQQKQLAGHFDLPVVICSCPADSRTLCLYTYRRAGARSRRKRTCLLKAYCFRCIIYSANLNMGVCSMRMCEWCAYKENKWLLHKSSHWSVYLADVQDYVGRCILVLNRHCGSLSELDLSEWIELKTIVDKLEYIYKEVLGAELSNWSCLLNNFYKGTTPDPHLHLHVRPRYKNEIIINNHAYTDAEFAHHYAQKKEDLLLEEDKHTLYLLMQKHFAV